MSVIRTTIGCRQKNPPEDLGLQVNPIKRRNLIFKAILELYRDETTTRTLYLDSTRTYRKREVQTARTFRDNNASHEVNIMINRFGMTYIVDAFGFEQMLMIVHSY